MRKDQVSRFKIVATNVDEMREHYAKTIKPARVDPLSGEKTITVDDIHFSMGGFDIWSGTCSSGMGVRFSEPAEIFALYVPIAGTMEFDFGGKIISSVPNTLFACNLDKSTSLQIHPKRSHLGIAFSKKVVTQYLSELIDAPLLHDIEFLTTMDMMQGTGRKLADMSRLLWANLMSDTENAATMRSNEIFLQAIMAVMLESVDHRYSGMMERVRSPALPRHVKRAIDYMTVHIAMPLAVEEIAQNVGVSVRALQLAFQQFKDTTPLAYLRKLRLEGARSDLTSQVEDSVLISDIARRWGFVHMGRFSALYASAFGETPKESIRRSQQNAPRKTAKPRANP